MMSRADEQRKVAQEMSVQLQQRFDAGDKSALNEIAVASRRAQEAEEEYAFRRDQYRRIEEQATFQGVSQQTNTASGARIQQLEAMVENCRSRFRNCSRH